MRKKYRFNNWRSIENIKERFYLGSILEGTTERIETRIK
jgi:hypothetical protein